MNSLFTSVVASGVFALVASLYITYFFDDPSSMAAESTLLPQDIGQALQDIAINATSYKIFVRTGRHFRAEVLPVLIQRARKSRHPIQIEVVLLDFRDEEICNRYSNYRSTTSFDSKLWNTSYVQQEVLATILALIRASNENVGLVSIHLFLSKRLSIFRIEGSSDEILVTREDPKDPASRYRRAHRDFAAFVTEFTWIRDDSFQVVNASTGALPATVVEIFGEDLNVINQIAGATAFTKASSPYAR